MGKLFFDKADVAAAFHAGKPNFGQVVEVRVETQVLFQVVRGDVVASHRLEVALAVAHDNVGLAFHQNPECVRIKCQMREKAV
jgi:hypothetical protein